MCDYSLMGLPNRLATEGEELLVHRFATGSIGLTESRVSAPAASSQTAARGFWAVLKQLLGNVGSPQALAVCVPPGARLLVQDIPHSLQRSYQVGCVEEVAFTQLSAAENSHRDAIRFNNGTEIPLYRLHEGQRVRVLRLSLSNEEEQPPRTSALLTFAEQINPRHRAE